MKLTKFDDLRPGLWRFSAAIFLATLVLFYLAEPYLDDLDGAKAWKNAIFSLVLFTGALAVGERKNLLIWGGILCVAAILPLWVNHLRPDILPRWFPLATGLVLSLFVSYRLVRFILRVQVVDSEVLCAAVATYLMFALACTLMYILVGMSNPLAFAWTVDPGAHRRLDNFPALYFSLTTQATLGYGDIVPVSPTARLLAMTQAVGGMFYMTLIVARLVSVYSSDHKSGKP
jgi:voltage-gated potassium channel